MSQGPLTKSKTSMKTDICHICRAAVEQIKEHLQFQHRESIVRMGDIFWVRGAMEAFYSGNHYKPESR